MMKEGVERITKVGGIKEEEMVTEG